MRQTRRMFLKQSGLAMMAVGAVPGILRGATDKIRVGFIGVGNRGSQLLQSFMKNDDCEVAALCDVYRPFLDRDRAAVDPRIVQSIGARVPKLEEKIPAGCKRFEDFRELLASDCPWIAGPVWALSRQLESVGLLRETNWTPLIKVPATQGYQRTVVDDDPIGQRFFQL